MIGLAATPLPVATSRGMVECAQCGDGPAVLLLHGALGGYDQALLLGNAAAELSGFRFVAPSRPGYLGTSLALGRSPEEQAETYAALLDCLRIPNAAVIAISGGGQSALQFALRYGDRCRALVMISACSAPIAGGVPLRFHLMRLLARFPSLLRRLPRPAAEPLTDPEADSLMRALQASTLDRMKERLPGTVNDIDQSRRSFDCPVERITVPLLVIHGTNDEAAPVAQAQQLAARVAGADLMLIEGGTHRSLFTHLRSIRARVETFLEATA